MPFDNTGTASIDTYNDIGGNQYNNTQTTIVHTYSDVGRDQHNIISGSIVNIYSSATRPASGTRRPVPPPTPPSAQPYREFLDTVVEIQGAIEPIARIVDDLVDELSDVLMTTALAGRLMELMEQTGLKTLFFLGINT